MIELPIELSWQAAVAIAYWIAGGLLVFRAWYLERLRRKYFPEEYSDN